MATKLSIPDKRMLQLMEWAIQNKVAGSAKEYFEAIGFAPTNITNVKNGKQGFTRDQVEKACRLTGASADWILNLSEGMFRTEVQKSPVQLLREVTAQIEQQLGIDKLLKGEKAVNKKNNSTTKSAKNNQPGKRQKPLQARVSKKAGKQV